MSGMTSLSATAGIRFTVVVFALYIKRGEPMAMWSTPRATVPALVDLHHLLIALGFRRDSRHDSNVVQEVHNEVCETRTSFDHTPTGHGARSGNAARDDSSGAQHGDHASGKPPDRGCRNRHDEERR